MEAFISGTACRGVFVEGAEAYFVNLDRPTEKIPLDYGRLAEAAICRILSDSPDIQRLSVRSVDEGLLALLAAANKDSALRIFEIALEFEDDPDFAIEAITELEILIQDKNTYDFLCNYAFSIPYCSPLDKAKLPASALECPLSSQLISEIIDAQSVIVQARTAWSRAVEGRFTTLQAATAVEKLIVDAGGFKRVCDFLSGKTTPDMVVLDLHLATMRVQGHRELISAWMDALGAHTGSKPDVIFDFAAVARADKEYEKTKSNFNTLAGKTEKVKFLRVQEQKGAIVERLQRGDIVNARRFTRELIAEQINADDSEFAAKTLCALAQEAKHLGHNSLQLEWTRQSTEVYADDPWPFAQAGDVFMSLYRYDEAIEYFDLAETKGDYHYGRMGKARIALLTGRLEEAYQVFKEIVDTDPFHNDTVLAWIGMGDVKRNTGNLDEALAIYDDAATRFPNSEAPLCEKASVLRQLGQLDEALEIYVKVSDNFNEPMKALTGRGEVHRSAGEFDEALVAYSEAIKKFPGEQYPVLGHAQSLREAGNLEDALREFEAATVRFNYEPRSFSGLAQTLRDLKRFPEALKTLEDAVKQFPYESYLHNVLASVTKQMGKLEEALRVYDRNCGAFPYNLPALIGRMQLLKEFERLDLALDAVEIIAERHPCSRGVQNAKASVLVLQGRYDEAMQLLPTETPRTFDEWKGHHIRCMIHLRQGDLDNAITELKLGLTHNPFHRSKAYYQNALAAAELRQGHYEAARNAAATGSGAAAVLLTLQSEAALGNTETAVIHLRILETDPHDNVVYLANEIARQYQLKSGLPQHDATWVANRNAEIIVALAA